ncbi:MAG: YraN family protein [Desulfohalobiaceae bacterium]|nr:YraN family protein [Desulfohalobiaceae bacterium]
MVAGHIGIGRAGEQLARTYLQTKGFEIVSTNWRSRKGELDIVCTAKELILFVEVKARSGTRQGLPGEALNEKKQKSLIKAASSYLSRNRLWGRPCRFDFIAVYFEDEGCSLEHITDVIQFPQAVDRSYSNWQPW